MFTYFAFFVKKRKKLWPWRCYVILTDRRKPFSARDPEIRRNDENTKHEANSLDAISEIKMASRLLSFRCKNPNFSTNTHRGLRWRLSSGERSLPEYCGGGGAMGVDLSSLAMKLGISQLGTSDHASVVSINIFVALICACIVIGHLLEENRWMNESITSLIIVSLWFF